MRHARTFVSACAIATILAACGGNPVTPTPVSPTPTLPPAIWTSPTRGLAPPPIAFPSMVVTSPLPTATPGGRMSTSTATPAARPPSAVAAISATTVATGTPLPRPALGTPQGVGAGTPVAIAGVTVRVVAVSGGGPPLVRDPLDRVGVPLFRLQVTISLGNDTDTPLPFRLADFALVDRFGDPTGPRATAVPGPLPASGTIAPRNERTGIVTFHVMPTQQGLTLVWLPHPVPDAPAPGSARLAIGDAAAYAPGP